MKRFYKFLMPLVAIVAMALPWNVRAQETLIVADGTTTSSYVPVYGLWVDDYTRAQMIYPATMLEDMTVGSTIESLTFFSSNATQSWGAATFEVRVGEVEATTLSSSYISYTPTTVYTGALTISSNQMIIEFDAPYVYMGGNLMVEIWQTVVGTYQSSSFYGVSATGASASGYHSSSTASASFNQRNFLPKMEIAYALGGDITCYRVRNLTASDIDSASITLNWVDTLNSGATYTVAYWTATDDTLYDYSSSTSITIDGLSSNTQYFFAVTPNCADGSTASAATGNWRTACGTEDIPYSEGFESFTTMAAPECWTALSGNVYVRNSSTNSHTGSQYLDFRGTYSNAIALPPMSLPTNQLQVRFWTRPESFTSNSCGTFSVGYMTDITVDSSFVELANWAYNDFSAYEEKEVPMIGAPDNARIVLRQNANATNYYWYVDDLVVEPIPACPHPISVSVSNVTDSDVDISIVGVDGLNYRIYYGSDTNTIDSVDITSATYTLTGLSSNTLYTLSVVTICDDGTTTRAVSTFFRTACSGYAIIPFSEDFEAYVTDDVPNCWLPVATGANNGHVFPSVYIYPSNTRNGNGYLEFESSASSADTEIVALPEMQNISSLKMIFWASSSSSYPCTLEVGVLESDSSFTRVDSIPLVTFSGASAWKQNYHEYTVYFARYTGTGERIAMRAIRAGSGQFTMFIDDLTVVEDNGCYPLVSVSASEIDSTSITLSWLDTMNSGSAYTLAYWVNGDTTEINSITDTFYAVTGLDANTLYHFMVTPNCSGGNGDSIIVQFRTDCGTIAALPWNESFEDYPNGSGAIPCWAYMGPDSTELTIVSTNAHNGTKSYRFGGNATTPHVAVLPEFVEPISNLMLSFWAKSENATLPGNLIAGYVLEDTLFVGVDTMSCANFTTMSLVEVAFSGAPAGARMAIAQKNSGDNYWWWIDDVNVDILPTCMHPMSVSASGITANDADITIVGVEGSNYRLYWTDGTTTDSVDLSTDSYSLTGLTGRTNYTVSVATICDDGTLTRTVSTSFKTACEAGSCDVVIDMVDSWGDGWNGAAIRGYVGSEQVFSATLPDDEEDTYTYSHCASDTLVLKWHVGSYDSETSFEITLGGNPIVSGDGDDYSEGEVIATITSCPSCLSPSGFALDSVSTTEATFHWATGDATEWVVIIDGDSTDATTVTTASMTVTGLSANTLYTVAISAICASGDTSMSLNASFRTACGAITALPWTEDFNSMAVTSSATDIPCWSYLGTGGYVNIISSSYSYSGNCLRFYPNGSNSTDHVIVLPEFDTVISGLEMSFWTRPESSSYSGSLSVGYVTNPTQDSTFVEMLNIPATMGTTVTQYEVTFTSAPAGSRIAMRHNVGSSSWYWFVDEINVHPLSGCPKPTHFTSNSASADSVIVAWNENGTATTWELAVGAPGFNPDSVTPVTVYDSSHVFTDLLAGNAYEIYVRADCGAEQSMWVGPQYVVPGQYIIGTTGSDTISMCGGVIYDDGGATGSYSNSADFTLVVYPTSTDSILSFHGSAYTESSLDYLRIYEGTSTTGTLLWQTSSSSQLDSIPLTISYLGPVTLKFHSDGSVVYSGFELFVNCVAAPTCHIPSDLTVSDVTGSGATISWTPTGDESQWMVTMNGVSTIVSTPSYTATGLTGLTNYNVSVRAICAEGDTSMATGAVSFTTTICDNPGTVDNWDTTMTESTSAYTPLGSSFYKNSYVQIIVDSATMSSIGGDVTAMAFYSATGNQGSYYNHMDVYLANVSEDSLTTGFIHADSAHTFVQVVNDGDFRYSTAGEHIVGFNAPFTWDGHSNVLLTVNRAHGSYTSGASFVSHNHGTKIARYVNSDYTAYDITSVTGGTATTTVGDIKFFSCEGGAITPCATPAVTDVAVTDTSATVTFTGSAASYEVAAVAGTWAEPTAPISITGLTHTFTGLASATQYAIGVRAVCADGTYSSWVVTNVTTADHPCYMPTELAASDVTITSATLGWTIGEAETEWMVNLTSTVASVDTTFVASTNPVTLTGLTPKTPYMAKIRAICSTTQQSDWTEAITFTTDSCRRVDTAPTVSGITSHSAVITWAAGSNSNGNYQIDYGYRGITQGYGTRVEVTGVTTYTLDSLLDGTAYDVYVRSMCATGVYSAWSPVGEFTTAESQGIDDVNGSAVVLYPNPATVSVTISGIEGQATVTIVDLNGRESGKWNVENGEITIDVSDMAKGAYFVRIVGEQSTAIRKLVIR